METKYVDWSVLTAEVYRNTKPRRTQTQLVTRVFLIKIQKFDRLIRLTVCYLQPHGGTVSENKNYSIRRSFL